MENLKHLFEQAIRSVIDDQIENWTTPITESGECKDNDEILEEILNNDIKVGENVFDIGLERENVNLLKMCVRNRVIISNKTNKSGKTALHIAIQSKDVDLIRELVLNGLDPNIRNNDGDTPLSLIEKSNDKTFFEKISLWLKGERITEKEKQFQQLIEEQNKQLFLAKISKLGLSTEHIEAFVAWQKEGGAVVSREDSEKIVQISANLELQVKENTEIISRIDKDLGTDQETQLQRQFIENNAKFKEYCRTIRLGLNNAFLAASVIRSGNVKQSGDFLSQRGCDSLGALSKQVVAKAAGVAWREAKWIPVVGSIPALIEAMAGFAADTKKQRQMNNLQHVVADSNEAAKIAERVARLLTLAKQQEIINPPEAESSYKSRIVNFITTTIQKAQDFQSGDETTITRLQALADMDKLLEYMMSGQVKAEKMDLIVNELVQLVVGTNYSVPVFSSSVSRVSCHITTASRTVVTTANAESALSGSDGQMMKTMMEQMKAMQEKMARLERENNKLKKKVDELDQDNEIGEGGLAQISKSSTSRQSPSGIKRIEHLEKKIMALEEGIAHIGEAQALMSEKEKYSPRTPQAIIAERNAEREHAEDRAALISAKSSRSSEEFSLT